MYINAEGTFEKCVYFYLAITAELHGLLLLYPYYYYHIYQYL